MSYQKVARVGDFCSCGAMILNGSPNTFINNRPAAFLTSRTSHNSTIMICSGTCILNGKKMARMMDMHNGCPIFPPHPPSPIVSGSPNVYVK